MMDSDKIIQLTVRLMEQTSARIITWTLVNRKDWQYDEDDNGVDTYTTGSTFESFLRSAQGMRTVKRRWERFIYSAPVDGKVFRLNGKVYSNGKYGHIRFQLWNEDSTELEYEFPDNASYVDLFNLVHNLAADEADEFVDQFLEKSELLVAAH